MYMYMYINGLHHKWFTQDLFLIVNNLRIEMFEISSVCMHETSNIRK